jgi:hypothetical protein
MNYLIAYKAKNLLAIGLPLSFLTVTTFHGQSKLAEGEICLPGIREVHGMKFDRNRDCPTEVHNGVPLSLQGHLWTVLEIRP